MASALEACLIPPTPVLMCLVMQAELPSVFTRFLLLITRLPPRSTLFPYTTPSDLAASHRPKLRAGPQVGRVGRRSKMRSEEHTSELQSHSDLVCRLLLEKKN